MTSISRRELGTALSLGGAATLLPSAGLHAAPLDLSFPAGFKWGAATAAYQIEGAIKEDGRGESIWEVFSHTPGTTAGGANADVACDSYHRYKEDTQLLKNMGANAYRFSIAWPRIFPNGRGQPNMKGVDHYKRLIDDLLANGVEPHVTLFHWDLPTALPGGWTNRDTSHTFADYAGYMAGQISDRVSHFMTTNEMRSFIDLGYGTGQQAPGLKLPHDQVFQARHHAVLAHGLGVQAIRAHARAGTQIGLAENASAVVPVIASPEHIAAARTAMRDLNASYLTAVLEGAYPESYLEKIGSIAPKVQAGDMKIIGSALDFVSINNYAPTYVRAAPEAKSGFVVVEPPASYPTMSLPWLKVGPEGLYWALRLTSEIWKPKALYVSENGAVSDDKVIDGRIDDLDRVMYLRNYVGQMQRAVAEGHPVKGYFIWSLMDNFEWAEGFSKRFGVHYTDYATQRRIPKLSATWYKALIAKNAMV